jgi:hypothetical protein
MPYGRGLNLKLLSGKLYYNNEIQQAFGVIMYLLELKGGKGGR